MLFYNIKTRAEEVSFRWAAEHGIGSDGGLYFPKQLPVITFENPKFNDAIGLNTETCGFVDRSVKIMQSLIKGSFEPEIIDHMIRSAFNFPIHLKQVDDKIFALELFHGPTLAFKDFGARFMAQALSEIIKEADKKMTIITATSGDTGAAVAHAFHNLPNIQVIVLYPHKKISEIQEQLFCTLGGNVRTFAVRSDFDACQSLVKQSLTDDGMKSLGLNSANSINISRVLAQSLYYYEAIAQLNSQKCGQKCDIISVPSGNFGNLTAGLIAQRMGLTVGHFIAATNANDTVPRYLNDGQWKPNSTVATLSNAMDVSRPNNWPRIEEMFINMDIHKAISGVSISEDRTKEAMRELYGLGYIADPHTSVAYAGLKNKLQVGQGVFLATAHPAKFKQSVDEILGIDLPSHSP